MWRRAADAGLGVTVHAGEFSQANIAQAVALPGVSRLGHAVVAAADQRLLDAVARHGVTNASVRPVAAAL